MAEAGAKVLFDASRTPGYAETRRRLLRGVTIILLYSMLGIPLASVMVWVMLEVVVNSGIDPVMLGAVVIAIIILDELLMFFAVRPALGKGWKVPTRITEDGVAHAGRSIRFEEVARLVRLDVCLVMEMAAAKKKATLFHAQLGDVDEFVRVFKEQAPGVEYIDLRKRRSND